MDNIDRCPTVQGQERRRTLPLRRGGGVLECLDAVEALLNIIDGYQRWRDNMPPGLAGSATAERIDEVLALHELVEQLEAAELPKGFGRD